MKKRDYGRAGEKVGVCKVSPGADGEGTPSVLGLDCVCATHKESAIEGA